MLPKHVKFIKKEPEPLEMDICQFLIEHFKYFGIYCQLFHFAELIRSQSTTVTVVDL